MGITRWRLILVIVPNLGTDTTPDVQMHVIP